MSNTVIRVSEWAASDLRKRAADERRTITAVVDRLLGRPWPAVNPPLKPNADLLKVDHARRKALSVPEPDDAPPVVGIVAETVAEKLKALGVTGTAALTDRCPKCGCSSAVHKAGNSGSRCENHPPCMWKRDL